MRSKRCVLLALIAWVCFLQGCMLRQSADGIRNSLLNRTPIGTRYETVEAYVKSKGWHWEQSSWNGPYRSEELKYFQASGGSSTNVSKEMGAYLGNTAVFPVSQWGISGYWMFDSKDQLVDIYISRRLMGL